MSEPKPTIEIRIIGPADAAVLSNIAPGVFDHDLDAGHRDEFLADPRHHLAVALNGRRVVGMASAVHYIHPDKPNELWINELGVTESHRRQGIGKALLRALFEHGKRLGCREAWVLTEPENLAARGLYSAVGGVEEAAVAVAFKLGGSAGADVGSERTDNAMDRPS